MTPLTAGVYELDNVRENIRLIVQSTTPEDAIHVYEAIKTADPGGLGSVSILDVKDPQSLMKIRKEGITLYEIFSIASKYDAICAEWVTDYRLTFTVAYPKIRDQIAKKQPLNTAITQTFLEILAEYPDTFIARKAGADAARKVSSMAEEVIGGHRRIHDFDVELRKQGNLLNPGTTADIVSAALALHILNGYRP
jgi:triphosphoribosyl-dephospho-CoA synthase